MLKKLCLKVGLDYVDSLPASEASIISSVKVTEGCFQNGAVGLYKTEALERGSDGYYKVDFKDIPVEIRGDDDPYTVFTAVDPAETADLSIFFWLSMGCLCVALLLIFYLGCYYHFYISVD